MAVATSIEPKLVGIVRPICGGPTFATAFGRAVGAPRDRRSNESDPPVTAAARTAAPSALHAANARRVSLQRVAMSTCSVMRVKLERRPSEKLLRSGRKTVKGFQQTAV